MTKYLAGRLLAGLMTLFIFVTILFFMAEWLMPKRQEPGEPSAWEQYVDYLGGIVSGEFLQSGALAALPWTLLIFAIAIGIAFPLGHWLGKVAGWRDGGAGAAGLTIASVGLFTIFPPLLVFFLVVLVSAMTDNQGIGTLRALFNEGALSVDTVWSMLWTFVLLGLVLGVAALLLDRYSKTMPRWVWVVVLVAGPLLIWAAQGMLGDVGAILRYLALPIIAVAVLALGEVVLVSKSTIAEASHEDFVFTAKAKGVPERQIRDHHVARYALLPTLSKLMVSVPFILVGLMIIEISFSWPKDGAFGMFIPGMSSTLFTSLENRDTTTVVEGLIAVGVVVLIVRLFLDVLHAALDPRIRVGSRAQ